MLFEEEEAQKLKQALMAEAKDIAAKQYSHLRGGYTKWGFTRHQGQQEGEVEVLDNSVSLYLSVKVGEVLQVFPVNSLRQRIGLKRNFDVFEAALRLWDFLNPFHIKGICKATWVQFNEFLYIRVTCLTDTELAVQLALQDTSTDFYPGTALVFMDFYHSLFEYVDNACKSRLVSEYVRLIKRIFKEFSSSRRLDNISLHAKHHLQGVTQPSFGFWMLPFLKELKRPKNGTKAPEVDALSFVRST